MDPNRISGGNYTMDRSPLGMNKSGKYPGYDKNLGISSPTYQNDEEEQYNRRRSEGLRKQMQNPIYQQAQQQPLRQRGDSPESMKLYDSRQQIPERDRGAATHFTLGPQIREENINQDPPPHIREHISNVQSDNQSLMRRLNLVMQELERVNREKDELFHKLQYTAQEQSDISKMLNSEDNVDKVNKYMQDDLAYERDRNYKIKQQIKELETYKGELIKDLRKLQELQELSIKDNKDMTFQLSQKHGKIQDLEREMYFVQEKMKATGFAIEDSQKLVHEDNGDKIEMDRIIGQLMQERNDLLSRLEHLTRKYDECVKEISLDRAEMETHNREHSKLITAKILFQTLEQIQKDRLRAGYAEFVHYCTFDNKCHKKLSELANIFNKIGQYKLKIALRQWYSKSLKPCGMKAQSFQLAEQISGTSLKHKMFYAWRSLYMKRIKSYDSKTNAIQRLWQRYNRESQIETKRAFLIWKEVLEQFKLKKQRVKKLLWKLYFNKLNLAMNTWMSHNASIDSAVRLDLLAKQFSHKQYMTVMFNNFRYQITEGKRKRHNILFHCLKSWKDYISYNRFLMGSNVAALQLRREFDSSIIKGCFDALKQNKEQEKFIRTHQALHGDELPKIQELNELTDNMEIERKFKSKSKACDIVKRMMAKQLYTYFKHWQAINEDYKEKLRTTIKDKISKLYMETMRKAFNHWKVNHNDNKITQQTMVVEEMQQEQQQLQNEVIELQKQNQQKQEQMDCCQHKQTLKCVLSYQKRMKQLAIARWRDAINETNIKEDGAELIIKRIRQRFLRQAFDMYLKGVKYQKKVIVEEERCKMYNSMRDERNKRKVFNAWILFKSNHSNAKNYWYRIFLRLEGSMKQAAIKKWKEVNQMQMECELKEEAENTLEQIDTLNKELGRMHMQETQQKAEIKAKENTLGKQAQRIIANAFARYYYTNETRGFEKWKEYVQFEKKKQRLMRKYIDHMMKWQFYYVKSCFRNWILNSNIEERKDQLKKEEMRLKDANFQIEQQNKGFDLAQEKLNKETEEVKQIQEMYNKRMQKTVNLIINKVDNNHSTTYKRYIFAQWRAYVKREVAFINCVKSVITKSLLNKGFQYIKSQSRVEQKQANLETVLNKFRMKFWKRTCGNAFSVWRSGQFSTVNAIIQEVEQFTQQINQEHDNKRTEIKNNNMNRAARLIVSHNLKNLFFSWRNVIKHMKSYRLKKESCQREFENFWKINAIRKWQGRKQATKLAKLRSYRLKQKFYNIRLRLYFNALRTQFGQKKDFILRLSNLANIHDQQGLKSAYNAIKSYAKSKEFVHQKRKENSSNTIYSILEGILKRRKQQYLTDLRLRCLNKRKIDKIKGFTILYNIGNQLRHYFQKWKNGSNERSLAKEMHEEGPIREQVFDHRIEFTNLVDLMQKEGYEDKEIADALQQEKLRQSLVLLKGVRRMQHYNEDLYLKPKVLDLWKNYVHQRKLFKYWLGFVDKRSKFLKSDLHQAFDQWKHFYPNRIKELQKLPKKELEKRLIRNNQKLEKIAEHLQDKENIMENIHEQREDLCHSYIKGQKLALSLWQNHQKRSLHQAFLKWVKNAKGIKNSETLNQLRSNLDFLENLKQRIKQLEQDNEMLANENEDFRQFSLDGYEIAKNVQALSAEREKLSVDLADKAQMIRKLLDENEMLNSKLKYAKDEASSMIKSTMAGSSGFKTGAKGYSSLTRSAF